MYLYRNTSLRFSKNKLHLRPFSAACSGMYFESLNGMPLILILLQNDPQTPPRKLLPRFEEKFSLFLLNTSKFRMNL